MLIRHRWMMLAFFVLVSGVLASPKTPTSTQKTVNLKKYESERMIIYFTGEFREHVRPLAQQSETFLEHLETRWAVILPKEKITVSLGKTELQGRSWPHANSPRWLISRYDPSYRRISLRVLNPSRFQLAAVARALHHEIIHYLLNQESTQLPPYMEEGIARYYSSGSNRYRYMAVWGFQRTNDVKMFLKDKNSFSNPVNFYPAAAVSGVLIDWMWRSNPSGEQVLLQQLLQGKSWRVALKGAGFDGEEELLTQFEFEVRPKYKWHTITYSFDFWLNLICVLIILRMIWRVSRAWKACRAGYMEIEPQPEVEVDKALFSGPAFGGRGDLQEPPHPPKPIVPPRAPARERPVPRPIPPHAPARASQPQAITPPRKAPEKVTARDVFSHSPQRLDGEVDDLFNQLTTASEHTASIEEIEAISDQERAGRKQPTDKAADIDEELDNLFDKFE